LCQVQVAKGWSWCCQSKISQGPNRHTWGTAGSPVQSEMVLHMCFMSWYIVLQDSDVDDMP
jgi:hypothetical protein